MIQEGRLYRVKIRPSDWTKTKSTPFQVVTFTGTTSEGMYYTIRGAGTGRRGRAKPHFVTFAELHRVYEVAYNVHGRETDGERVFLTEPAVADEYESGPDDVDLDEFWAGDSLL